MITIMGSYDYGEAEEIDTTDTREGADYLLDEYRMAFGEGWIIWTEEQERGQHE